MTQKIIAYGALFTMTLITQGCATSPKDNTKATIKADDKVAISKIQTGETGGLIMAVDKIKDGPCTRGALTFKNQETGKAVTQRFEIGMFGISRNKMVLKGVAQGTYYPSYLNCTGQVERSGRLYQTSQSYTIQSTNPKGIVVTAGEVLYGGTYSFFVTNKKSKRKNLDYKIIDESRKAKSFVKSNNPELFNKLKITVPVFE